MSQGTYQPSPNDIAIVGMALRVPGARSVSEFWRNLRNGVESIRSLSPEELDAAAAAGDPIDDPHYVPRTADMADMAMFDAEFFGMSPKEAAIMDPQHRHFLECAWEAMEDAGRMPERNPGPVGVFAGSGMGSYFYFNVCSNAELVSQVGMFLLRHTGNDKDFLSTRASFLFDLRGPSVNVQTACSSSLVAVHQACQSLLSGECDMALAGGVTIEQPHRRGYLYQDGEILSPDGHCRAFDHRAGGTVFGSGAGVVVLRRLADAMADGDIIHGVIKGSAVNNDGASKAGYLAPSVTGQAEAIIEAQGVGGIDPDSVGYVECHGTGTYLGDPIEIEALTEAFRQSTGRKAFCRIGSVKSNIGHLDTAAGVVSLIKATLTVKHGEIPPTLGFEKPNPAINFAASPFIVNAELTPWPDTSAPRRAGVNSLGVGGTNAHVVVEQAPARAAAAGTGADVPTLLLLSTRQRKANDDASLRLGEALRHDATLSLDDVAFTLNVGRKAFTHRRAVAVRGRDDAIAALTQPELKRNFDHTAIEGTTGAVFLFPGGGAQHHGMARSLYEREPEFRATVDEGLAYLEPAVEKHIRAVWFEADAKDFLKPSIQLPAILIVEVAIARLWQAWGITPTALIGHSMGENAAACIAGVMSFKDAVRLVELRGKLFDTIEKGGMLSVSLDPQALAEILPERLDIASVNAPGLCVVSGRDADLEEFRTVLQARGVDCARVAIDIAAHSRMLDGILPAFEAFLRSITLRAPRIPIMSNRDGLELPAADAVDPTYWVRHLRGTVQFAKGLATLAADKSRVYIEVGPSRAMSSLAKAQGTIDANQVINSLPHPDEVVDEQLYVLSAIGRAWAVGLPVKVERSWAGRSPQRVQLPSYPFQHRHYFIERQAPVVADDAAMVLRKQADIADWGYRPAWKKSLADYSPGTELQKASWLIFLDDGDTGAQLSKRLRAAGHRVVTVKSGDGFAKRGADDYVLCPEDGRPGFDALMSGLSADGPIPDRVVHLWLLTHTGAFRPGSSYFHRVQESGLYGLLYLAQAMAEAGVAGEPRVTVITNGLQRVLSETVPHPEKATIEGPALVIPREMPGATVRLIDTEIVTSKGASRGLLSALKPASATPTPQSVLDLLWEDILGEPRSEVVAYRNGARWTRGHERLPLAPTDDQAPQFRQNGVYLLTGGYGDLALSLAAQLADRFAARIVLVGRTALPPREQWNLLARMLPRGDRRLTAMTAILALEAKGCQVLTLSGDVGNTEDMLRVVTAAHERFGALHGVLHTAGVVDDGPLQLKTYSGIEAVLAPKVLGTEVLHTVLKDVSLDFLVLFSSTSSDTAPAGQADYVAANAYLNAYAESQAGRPDRKTVALHWGIWNEVGLAARSVEVNRGTTADQRHGEAIGPLFQRWVEDETGMPWLEATVGPQSHWVFDEHRLVSGQPILPGTGYLELIAEAIREYGLERTVIENLSFHRPLYVDDGQTKLVRLRFEPAENGYRVVIMAGTDAAAMQKHADADLSTAGLADASLATGLTAASERLASRMRRSADGLALRSAQEDHIKFGPRWKVLQGIAIGDGDAVAELRLPPNFSGDLDAGILLHPALLDIATGFAMELVVKDAPLDVLWAPVSYGKVTQYQPLPAVIRSWVRLVRDDDLGADYASFDIAVVDAAGELVLDIRRFVVKRLSGDLSFTDVTAAAPNERPHASAAIQQLAAQVRQGILPAEGFEALQRALATKQVQPIVSSIDLSILKQRAVQTAAGPAAGSKLFEQAELDSDFVAPANDIERTLARFWTELLGVNPIGVNTSFFDVGGHSLVAVRLFRMIRKEYGLDLPISTLFDAPTIGLCAALIAAKVPQGETAAAAAPAVAQPATRHLVTMHTSNNASATPLFICAGMFGNVLNLRHLSHQLGMDRSVYGLQARGLYGEEAPHETFVEMAESYLEEVRARQPHGPYLLAGFSGGGLVAYEMAQQLKAAGETVAHLILLDTPLPTQPTLSKPDLASMKFQDIRREGFSFASNWLGSRISWEMEKRRKRIGETQTTSESYHNDAIEASFRRALVRYELRPYDGSLTLFRPAPQPHYYLSGGRRLQANRNFIFDDNGWTPYVADLKVIVVPGDHDSMVLEPNVRVLAEHARARVRSAMSSVLEVFKRAAE